MAKGYILLFWITGVLVSAGVLWFFRVHALAKYFSAAWLSRVLCQLQVLLKFLFQRAAFLIVATVGWCPLNVALRVTRQAWLQRWWQSNIFNNVLHCCQLEHSTIKYLCLTWCIGDLPATHGRITWLFPLLFTWGHSALEAQGETLTCLLNSAELYGFWQNCILQFRSATCLVKPLTNDWPKQTFTYSAAFVSFRNGKMKRSLYSTFIFVTTCDALFHFLFAIPYPKRCCDHDNSHSTVVSYSRVLEE